MVNALQNHASTAVTWFAGAVTIALGVGATFVGAHMAPRLRHTMDWLGSQPAGQRAPGPAPVHAAEPVRA